MTCWQEVVPEYEKPETFQSLESAEIQKRWEKVRDEVEKYETKSQILYVLDWPGFQWRFLLGEVNSILNCMRAFI